MTSAEWHTVHNRETQTADDRIASFYAHGWECVGEDDAKPSAPKWWHMLQTNEERNRHLSRLILTVSDRTIISRHPTSLCPMRQGADAKGHLARIRRYQRNLTNRQYLTPWDEKEMKSLRDSGGWKKQRNKLDSEQIVTFYFCHETQLQPHQTVRKKRGLFNLLCT